MLNFSALLAICAGNSPVNGEFPSQRQVTRHFDIFFGPRLNKRLSKQRWGWWFKTPSCPLWHHCNDACQATLVTKIARSLAVMVSGERQRASQVLYREILYIEIRSWLSIKYTNIHKWPTHFVTYECTKLLCASPTKFYHDSFSFKENTYPVLNQRHISVDIRTAPFFTGASHARSRFSEPTLPQRAACCILSHVTFLLSPPGSFSGEPGLARFLFDI